MNRAFKYLFQGIGILAAVICTSVAYTVPASGYPHPLVQQAPDSTGQDSGKLRFRYRDVPNYSSGLLQDQGGIFLRYPKNIKSELEYDPTTGKYEFRQKMGRLDFRPSSTMSLDEYRKQEFESSVKDYWFQKSSGKLAQSAFIPRFNLGGEAFDKIFGSNVINITPQGSAELIFGYNMARTDNPTLSEKLRKTPSFNFDSKIQMNVTGSIGDKLQLGVNYNTEATFDFENKTKLDWAGEEDDIIKKIEAGNVSLPLTGSLITGSQSLFGLKTEMQFGKLNVTSIFSQQKGQTSVMEVKGGAQVTEFEVTADNYEANKHFFISQYFRERYNEALANLPIINSPINITRIEVWITNKTNNFENSRNILAFTDLGEYRNELVNDYWTIDSTEIYPDNDRNNIYGMVKDQVREIAGASAYMNGFLSDGVINGQDYEKIENARKLSEREFTFNDKLGYISLNGSLNSDEILAVAYEYTMNGKVYKVGELSSAGIAAPQTLVLKLIKGTNLTPKFPNWKLMMKNIYSLGAYQLSRTDFTLNILYQDDRTGNAINYLPEGLNVERKILLKLLGLDKLNSQLDPSPDGAFDFMEGITINSTNGRVIFPVLEPFGRDLEKMFGDDPSQKALARKYVFKELYDSTQTRARQIAEKNKFSLQGTYQSSSSSEIPLNAMNVPQGSVVVTAGGMKLTENVDFTVDYALGRVKITKPGLVESGTPIRISLENQSMFAIQTKTLIGTHLEYKVNEDLNIGGTVLHLTERPLTQKVNIGDEPISNTIWGFNSDWKTNSNFLTSMVDKLPFIQTKEMSSLSIDAEFAQLLPGSNKAIGKGGVAYIDDFEGSQTTIELKTLLAWSLASTPQGQPNLFREGTLTNNLANGFNRAKLGWYVIDPLFLRNNTLTPKHLSDNDKSSHFVREIFEKEIWPNKESPNNIPTNISVLNLAYYPQEKGPYNFDLEPGLYSAGIDQHGRLNNPASRWAGIMREIQTNDFEAMNVEFIEFWMMDPFVEWNANNPGGDLYFNLGNISEDILRDSRKAFENGLPTPGELPVLDTTAWGVVPQKQSLLKSFDNNANSRVAQDVGLDGLNNDNEQAFFSLTDSSYLKNLEQLYIAGNLTKGAFDSLFSDPASDDYHYFRGPDYDAQEVGILERYKKYNGLEGNSPASENTNLPYISSESPLPDVEDINGDNTLSESESYYQYRISLRKDDMVVGSNFITDKVTANVTLENGKKSSITWYQFKIPITDHERIIGSIQDFKSIRFMRLFMKGFQQTTILRFAKLELKRGEWRKYTEGLAQGSEGMATGDESGTLDISAVNIEENSSKDPVNYVLPPGIDRVIDPTNPQLRQLNEQSMVLKVQNLTDGDARAAFKNTDLDLRQYRRLRMAIHAEALKGESLGNEELTAFIRLGTDYKNNYYEYEVPLKITPQKPVSGYKDNDRDRAIVWPAENNMNISLELLTRAKLARNAAMEQPGSEVTLFTRFPYTDGKNKIYIVGNPNLSHVKTIMVGVRNPGNVSNYYPNDGLPKSGEVWINELRLTNFNDQGGWAANARASAKLADLGTVSLAGATSTPGFGSIEKKVMQRSTEQINSYDLSSNIELGKFFPSKANITIPMFVSISESFINPQYNPLDPDIPFEEALKAANSSREKRRLKELVQDYGRRKSINFTNVRFGKAKGKPKPWDLSNWTTSYSYSEELGRDIRTEQDLEKRYMASLGYNFSMRPKNVNPFKSIPFLKAPAFALIRDFNFNYLPTSFSFNTDMNRQYQFTKMRNLNQKNVDLLIEPSIYKDFFWNRRYDFKYDLTRSIKMDFTATNMARIDEPEGAVDRNEYKDQYELWKDSVMQNIRKLGRTVDYRHAVNVTYTLPLNKIPLLSWTSHSLRYGGTYSWNAGPRTADTIRLGNLVTNSSKIDFTGQYNLSNLYNKVGFLKKLNEKPGQKNDAKKPKEYKTVSYEKFFVQLKAGVPRSVFHQLNSDKLTVKVLDQAKREIPVTTDIANMNKVVLTPDSTLKNVTVIVEAQVEIKDNPLLLLLRGLGRAAIGVKNVSFTLSESGGTKLPGYMQKTRILGMDFQQLNSFSDLGQTAPGFPFLLGIQDQSFGAYAASKGWLTTDPRLSMPYMNTTMKGINLRSTIEPLPGMKIDLTANRQLARNASIYYFFNDSLQRHDFSNGKMISGNFNMSIISWKTAFDPMKMESPYNSSTFDQFRKNTSIISGRLRAFRKSKFIPEHGLDPNRPEYGYDPDKLIDGTNFYDGYSMTSQQVLLPAFFAAYTGKDPSKTELTPFPSWRSMMPNWRMSYDGLSRIEFLQRYIRSININHSYKSTYSVGTYSNNIEFREGTDGLSYVRDAQENFLALYDIGSASINEQFSPLVGVDVTWQSDMTTRIDIKKTRTATLSLANNQIIEMSTNELTIGAGYRFDDVQFTLSNPGGGQKNLKSDLNVKADLSIRDNRTILRQLVEQTNQPSAGQRAVSIKLSADYMLGPSFSLRLFFDRMVNKPYVSTSFPTYNTNIGFSLTFNLTQQANPTP